MIRAFHIWEKIDPKNVHVASGLRCEITSPPFEITMNTVNLQSVHSVSINMNRRLKCHGTTAAVAVVCCVNYELVF